LIPDRNPSLRDRAGESNDDWNGSERYGQRDERIEATQPSTCAHQRSFILGLRHTQFIP
jgi:hypothetical protein